MHVVRYPYRADRDHYASTLRERESVDIFASERVVAVMGLKTVFSL